MLEGQARVLNCNSHMVKGTEECAALALSAPAELNHHWRTCYRAFCAPGLVRLELSLGMTLSWSRQMSQGFKLQARQMQHCKAVSFHQGNTVLSCMGAWLLPGMTKDV